VGRKFYKMLLRDFKFGAWCAMSATRVTGSIWFSATINLLREVTHNDAFF